MTDDRENLTERLLESKGAVTPATAAEAAMGAGRMLVVDDEESVRRVCVRTLAGLGIDVESAGSADEAWRLLNLREFDCVLSDISMPGSMDGTQLTEEVKARFPATDMLIMTGLPTVQTAVSTLKHGALEYLIKPFAPATLESAVRRCFERRRLSGELDREKTLRRELEAAYAELQKVERSKDAFISVLDHELRTPLAIAISATEILAQTKDPKEAGKVLEMLRSSLARENEVVSDILLFSGLTSGELRAHSDEVRMDGLIGELVEDYRSVWEKREVRVEVAFEGGHPLIQGDRELIKTAFKHLLLNAIQFNMKGGSVRIVGKSVPGRLEVLVSDTGVGVMPELQARIFDRFYQVAEHMTRRVGGLGLGLAIVRRIVESHGGSVSVAAREEGGTEFLVSIPTTK